MKKKTKSLKIALPKDKLHLRPLQGIVEAAGKFQSDVLVDFGGQQWNCKSILDMMIFAAETTKADNGVCTLRASGEDAIDAVSNVGSVFSEALK